MLDKSDLTNLEKCSFYHSNGMQKQWVESNCVFLNYLGSKFGQIVRVSLVAGKVIETEVDEDLILKLKSPEEKKKHVDGLELWAQELYKQTKEEYGKFSHIIRKD